MQISEAHQQRRSSPLSRKLRDQIMQINCPCAIRPTWLDVHLALFIDVENSPATPMADANTLRLSANRPG